MRKILNDTKDCCCSAIEILCPCSDKESGLLVKFSNTGKVVWDNVDDLNKTICNLKEVFGFSYEIMILWQIKNQNLANNTSLNHNVPPLSVKEKPFDQRKDIYTDQDENDSDSHEPENDLQVEQSKCYNENLGNTMKILTLRLNQILNMVQMELHQISVKEDPFDQGEDIYTDQCENDLQVERSKCCNENDNLENTTAEDINLKTESNFEHDSDEIETIAKIDAEKNSNVRNFQRSWMIQMLRRLLSFLVSLLTAIKAKKIMFFKMVKRN